MTVDRRISSDGHLVRLGIEQAAIGWNLVEEVDSVVVAIRHYEDWHRLDRTMKVLELQIARDGVSAMSAH